SQSITCGIWFFQGLDARGATAQQQLSVVTTVWGVTTSTQSGPHGGGYTGGPTPAPPGNPGYGSGLGKVQQSSYQSGYRQNVPPGPTPRGLADNQATLELGNIPEEDVDEQQLRLEEEKLIELVSYS
ncbi:hypothetical protein NQ317_011951, partial [Molorchus minor]